MVTNYKLGKGVLDVYEPLAAQIKKVFEARFDAIAEAKDTVKKTNQEVTEGLETAIDGTPKFVQIVTEAFDPDEDFRLNKKILTTAADLETSDDANERDFGAQITRTGHLTQDDGRHFQHYAEGYNVENEEMLEALHQRVISDAAPLPSHLDGWAKTRLNQLKFALTAAHNFEKQFDPEEADNVQHALDRINYNDEQFFGQKDQDKRLLELSRSHSNLLEIPVSAYHFDDLDKAMEALVSARLAAENELDEVQGKLADAIQKAKGGDFPDEISAVARPLAALIEAVQGGQRDAINSALATVDKSFAGVRDYLAN